MSLGSACLNIKADMNVLKNVNLNIFGNTKIPINGVIQVILGKWDPWGIWMEENFLFHFHFSEFWKCIYSFLPHSALNMFLKSDITSSIPKFSRSYFSFWSYFCLGSAQGNTKKGLFYIIILCSCLSYFSKAIQPKRQNIWLLSESPVAMNSICL